MSNLIIVLTFVLVLLVLFACLPPKRAYDSANCFKIVAGAFSINKLCEALIEYFKNKKK
jgi:hypothetical protein